MPRGTLPKQTPELYFGADRHTIAPRPLTNYRVSGMTHLREGTFGTFGTPGTLGSLYN